MDATDQFSLRGKVFHTIRENILSGRYKYQEELRESTLGKELGVSRTPVREALRQLELEGLVTIVPNKGAYVNGITARMWRSSTRCVPGWKVSAPGWPASGSRESSWTRWRK